MTDQGGASPRARLRLGEVVGLVVGYALAALLVRSLWTAPDLPAPAELIALAVVYGWLGLAMAGPILLFSPRRSSAPTRRTRAESAWVLVGGYWIGLTLMLRPVSWTTVPAVAIPPLLVVAWRGLTLHRRPPEPGPSGWTHAAALGLLIGWPVVWGLMIFLARSLPG